MTHLRNRETPFLTICKILISDDVSVANSNEHIDCEECKKALDEVKN